MACPSERTNDPGKWSVFLASYTRRCFWPFGDMEAMSVGMAWVISRTARMAAEVAKLAIARERILGSLDSASRSTI